MQTIANGALVIATALFMWEILIMLINYFLDREAKKLVSGMIRKQLLFLIVAGFVAHIQAIMAFIFSTFENFAISVGSSFSGGSGSAGLSNPLYAWGALGNVWTNTMAIENTIKAKEGLEALITDIAPTILVFIILFVATLIILFVIIQFFLVQLDIVIQASIGSVAIAFSMLSYTQDIAKGYIKSLLQAGIRLFTMIIIIFFFNFSMEYVQDLFKVMSGPGYFDNIQNPFQLLTVILISMLALILLAGFLVIKAPAIVTNAMSGSGTGSGMDAAAVMAGAGMAAYKGAQFGAGAAKAAYNAPGAAVDAVTGFKPGSGNGEGGEGGMEKTGWRKAAGDWQQRLHINKEDFAQPKNPNEPEKK